MCTIEALLGHHFQEEFADNSSVSGVFTRDGKQCIDFRLPQPMGRREEHSFYIFIECQSIKLKVFIYNFKIFKDGTPVVKIIGGKRIIFLDIIWLGWFIILNVYLSMRY